MFKLLALGSFVLGVTLAFWGFVSYVVSQRRGMIVGEVLLLVASAALICGAGVCARI